MNLIPMKLISKRRFDASSCKQEIGRTNWLLGVALIVCVLGFTGNSQIWAQDSDNKTQSADAESDEVLDTAAEVVFTPDFEDKDLADTADRAWEFRPYSVAVWFCLDGSPGLNAMYKQVAHDVTRRSELMDASGWDLTTGLAPSQWRHRFIEFIDRPERCAGVESLSAIEGYDKLMIVCLSDEQGAFKIKVREFDTQTQQWGPLLVRSVSQRQHLGANVIDAISVAFMPLANIERVQEIEYENEKGDKKKKDEVVLQIRAVRSCVRTMIDEELNWITAPNKSAPAFIKDSDRFMPIIRRTDRAGNLVGLEPIDFTYLTVNSVEDAVLRTSIESSQRAPLSQRKSKRAQKLALVIRPPERPTDLFLVSNTKEQTPMEGFEVWSRRPGSVREEKSEFLGKTDWRGAISIPPSEEGLRLIYIKRGTRALKKLPIIPGLYESVESTLPSDETRLYAQGVVQGLNNEILSMVIQREVFETEAIAAIEQEKLDDALAAYNELKALSINDVKARMNDEEIRLKSLTSDARELGFINGSFSSLRKILNDQQLKSKESMLQKELQKMRESKISTSNDSNAN